MEGKEVRFGDTSSALYATASTQTSTGSVDSAEDSCCRWCQYGLPDFSALAGLQRLCQLKRVRDGCTPSAPTRY
jgi:K+-transporting ATPase A subunit